MAAPLFTDEPDPVERLHRTHEALSEMKDRHRALPAEPAAGRQPLHPARRLRARGAADVPAARPAAPARPTWNLVISNVPGPQFPLYCAGARLVANYPVSVITDGMGLNITVMSYDGHMDFGLVADRDQMPDLADFVGWLQAELDALAP